MRAVQPIVSLAILALLLITALGGYIALDGVATSVATEQTTQTELLDQLIADHTNTNTH